MKDKFTCDKMRISMRPSLKKTIQDMAKDESRSMASMLGALLQEAVTARSAGMTKEELLELRKTLQTKYEDLKRIGDFDANAGSVRMAIESLLKLTNHELEKKRK